MTPQYKYHMVCPQEKTLLISIELRQPSLVHLGHSICTILCPAQIVYPPYK
jgi:hypothetical protein